MIYQVKGMSGVYMGVSRCVRCGMVGGMCGCVYRCAWVCFGMRRCAGMGLGVCVEVFRCMGVHGYGQVCLG